MKKKIKILDEQFKKNKAQYFIQCLMATTAVMIILLTIDTMFKEVMIASFGATSFSVFAMPHNRTSRTRSVMGGYAIGITLGILLRLLAGYVFAQSGLHWIFDVTGAAAVGFSLLVMTMTNCEHPPAAGLALGLVLQGYHTESLLIISASVMIILVIKHLLRHWLINLY